MKENSLILWVKAIRGIGLSNEGVDTAGRISEEAPLRTYSLRSLSEASSVESSFIESGAARIGRENRFGALPPQSRPPLNDVQGKPSGTNQVALLIAQAAFPPTQRLHTVPREHDQIGQLEIQSGQAARFHGILLPELQLAHGLPGCWMESFMRQNQCTWIVLAMLLACKTRSILPLGGIQSDYT